MVNTALVFGSSSRFVAPSGSDVILMDHGGGENEIVLSKGARVEHYQLNAKDSSLKVHLEEDSEFVSYVFSEAGKQELNVSLKGSRAKCSLHGLYVTAGGKQTEHRTSILHEAANCQSQEYYKGVVGGDSKAIFNGKIIVGAHATNTKASMVNKNLLLDKSAEVDTRPDLEIYNDDVVCSHGATVGQLDEEAIFYLRSRGVELGEAKQLLVDAFINELLDKIEMKQLESVIASQRRSNPGIVQVLSGLLCFVPRNRKTSSQ